MSKILTIAIPTYNRAPYLEECLSRIILQTNEYVDDIEILISDNCSTDKTKEIVQNYIDKGINLTYNRNIENLGMDDNFIYCFKNAKSKYVWLLGDDDYIVNGAIKRILKILKENNFGLIHLDNNKNINEFKIYYDVSFFLQNISYYITFISGNIVKTEVIPNIDFLKYKRSQISQVPVYLRAAIQEKENIIVYFQTLDVGADSKTNGGYNIFEVFVENYLNIIKDFKIILGVRWYEVEKYKLFRNFIWAWMNRLLINSNHNFRFKTDKWLYIILNKYWYEPYLYPILMLFWIKKNTRRNKL